MMQPLRTSIVLVLLGALAAPGAELVLRDFRNESFDYTFGGFTQTAAPGGIRLMGADSAGGAGVGVGTLDLSAWSDAYLAVEVTPLSATGADRFDVELIDTFADGQTVRSGKWSFDTSSLAVGQTTTLVSATPLSNPQSGIGDFGALDLSQITSWQVLGDFGPAAPFDFGFGSVAVSGDVTPPPPYPGAEADAPWRAEAATRIDAIRKADLTVSVVDLAGRSVPGAEVAVAMQRHEFGFGSAVQAFRLRNNAAQHNEYKARVAELFNLATIENNLKWPPWEGEWGGLWTQSGATAALDWLAAQGIDGRGHVMVWPGADNLPIDIRQMLADDTLSPQEQAAVRTRIADHIAAISAATNGKVGAWDVINETRTNNDLMRLLDEGDGAMVDWFDLAAANAAGADRYINDFGILNDWGGASRQNRDRYFATIQQLQAEGAPIDGVGFQGHFSGDDLTGPEELWEVLDRFDQLGLAMQVTEFDVNTTDEQLQAAYTRDFLTAMFAHAGVDDVILWGFWEDAHWRPDAALFRSDWSIKPNGEAYLDLVFDEWWTEESTETQGDGAATVRGFKGDYEVSATVPSIGVALDAEVQLSDGGAEVTLIAPFVVGDYNFDGVVDAADYTVLRDTWGSTTELAADGDNNGVVDAADYLIWVERFGTDFRLAVASVPEPAAGGAIWLATLCAALLWRR